MLMLAFMRCNPSKRLRSKGGKYVSKGQVHNKLFGADRRLDLEISKPQKNTRNAVATAAGNNLRAGYNRRSRSPDYGRGGPVRGLDLDSGSGRDRSSALNSFERRVRDDYRPMRSPSPRGYRGRDDYRGGRERSPDRYFRGRSRSPYDRGGRYRSRSPRARDLDDEADLPIPRRTSADVPDVQLILVDEVDRCGAVDFFRTTADQRTQNICCLHPAVFPRSRAPLRSSSATSSLSCSSHQTTDGRRGSSGRQDFSKIAKYRENTVASFQS